ncbi:MAG: NADH-quinone oxidoreductase subunit K [Anaerolineae bacterium]|nr:NADH-quinone oxidoreductase subunit K [Thermoflexales bacterium]MDW8407359.1 NADH-quinone oxidoreductase subunit K [Anaerolineae bacterium]
MNLPPVAIAWFGAMILFGVGLYGLLVVRNLIKLVVALQILAKAAMLAFVAAGYAQQQMGLAQSMIALIIVADTVVAVIALALAVQVRRRYGTLDVRQLTALRG